MMALSGGRSSWLMLARKADLVREASSAAARACSAAARAERASRAWSRQPACARPPRRDPGGAARPAPRPGGAVAAGVGAERRERPAHVAELVGPRLGDRRVEIAA